MNRIRAECEYRVNKIRDLEAAKTFEKHQAVVTKLNQLKQQLTHDSNKVQDDEVTIDLTYIKLRYGEL